jgi:peptide/nickel transport system substrate-binding protein
MLRQMLSRRSVMRIAGAIGVGVGALSKSSSSGSALPTVQTGDEPTGDLVVGVAADPVSMDPRVSITQSGFAMLRHVFEPLVFRDDQMQLVPVLAESWERPDPKLWQLNLRQSVKFHNGEDFDAEAVKYTLESILSGENAWVNNQFAGYIVAIDRVEVKDSHTVLLHTTQPSNSLINNLAMIGMLPPIAGTESGENFTNSPVGTGPYQITEYTSNNRMVIEAFPEYWGEQPTSKTITFRILPEDATRLAALESGEAHLINKMPIDAIDRIESNDNLQFLSTPSSRIMFVGWWNDREPFTDIRVRQAFNHAIDKESLITALFGGQATIASGPTHPSVRGFNDQLEPYAYDPDKARDLLQQAGFGDGLDIIFGYPTGRYLMDKQVGEAIIGMLAEVGINCTPETAEWGTFFSNRGEGLYDAWLYGFGAATMDPDFAHQWFWRAPAAGGNYENEEVAQLLASADMELDVDKSTDLYRQAQQIIWEDAPWAFMYYQPDVYGAASSLQGFTPRIDEYFLLFNATVTE